MAYQQNQNGGGQGQVNRPKPVKAGSLWNKQQQTGGKGPLFTGQLKLSVSVFENSYKQKESDPDFVFYVNAVQPKAFSGGGGGANVSENVGENIAARTYGGRGPARQAAPTAARGVSAQDVNTLFGPEADDQIPF